MTEEFRNRVTMRPPTLIQVLGHLMVGVRPPALEGPEPVPGYDRARLVPYAIREFHRGFATASGLFWLPCVLCDRPFGGHECGGSIPDPLAENLSPGATLRIMICSRCTRLGRAHD